MKPKIQENSVTEVPQGPKQVAYTKEFCAYCGQKIIHTRRWMLLADNMLSPLREDSQNMRLDLEGRLSRAKALYIPVFCCREHLDTRSSQ